MLSAVPFLFFVSAPALSAAPAGPLSPAEVDAAAATVFGAMARAPHRRYPDFAASTQGPGGAPGQDGPAGPGDLLELTQYGDLALMQDPDGAWLAEALSHAARNDINWIMESIADRFYQDYDDDYEYLCVFMLRDLGVFFAFYQPLSNDILGIGYDSVVRGETFDLTRDKKTEGYIFMNYVGYWQDNPASGRYVFAQELGHRWGSFINVDHPDLNGMELLGRDDAHWSFWMDTPNSPMEGNAWRDNGDGTWSTAHTATSTYSDLDLYLMGLVGPDEVGPQTVLQPGPDYADLDPGTTPVYFGCVEAGVGCRDLTIEATSVVFELDHVIDAEGERVPGVDDSPKKFRMATIVLGLLGDEVTPEVLDGVHDVRRRFEAEWEEDVGGRADLDTTLGSSSAEPIFDYVEPDDGAVVSDPTGIYTGGVGCGQGGASLMLLGLVPLLRRRRAGARAG